MGESSTLKFTMHAAREVMEAGATHIKEQIEAIEQAVDENPGLVFDLAKALVESACKTILCELGKGYDEKWDTPKLLKETLSNIRLLPEEFDRDAEVADSIRKTVGGLQTVIQGLCELRNIQGFASHGKDPNFRQLDPTQALLVARAADVIVGFLFRAHWDYATVPPSRELRYDDHPEFNDYVDELHEPVRIFELEFRPSEVLYKVDPKAYWNYLINHESEMADEEESTAAPEVSQ